MSNPIPLEPGRYYHIYNRGNNRENIFKEDRNYAYFLKLYAFHVGPIADTYAYCLLRNHFHLFVRVKDLTGFPTSGEVSEGKQSTATHENLSGLSPSQAFSNFLTPTLRRSTRLAIALAHCFSVHLVGLKSLPRVICSGW